MTLLFFWNRGGEAESYSSDVLDEGGLQTDGDSLLGGDTLEYVVPADVTSVMNEETDRPIVYLDYHLAGNADGSTSPKTERIYIQLFTDVAPRATSNFVQLLLGKGPDIDAKRPIVQQIFGEDTKFGYAGSRCHRLVVNFILQCGDFELGAGMGGFPVFTDTIRTMDDEPGALALSHKKYYLNCAFIALVVSLPRLIPCLPAFV